MSAAWPARGAKCDIGAYELAAAKVSTAGVTDVGRTSATLHGSVTPNSGLANVQFIYGTTTKYGKKTSDRLLTGVAPTAVAATIRGLKPGVTYHYRLVATTSVGTVQGADRTVTTLIAPKLSRLTLTPKAFKAGRGTKIGYVDTQPATTSFVVLRLVRHRRPARVAGSRTVTRRTRQRAVERSRTEARNPAAATRSGRASPGRPQHHVTIR